MAVIKLDIPKGKSNKTDKSAEVLSIPIAKKVRPFVVKLRVEEDLLAGVARYIMLSHLLNHSDFVNMSKYMQDMIIGGLNDYIEEEDSYEE